VTTDVLSVQIDALDKKVDALNGKVDSYHDDLCKSAEAREQRLRAVELAQTQQAERLRNVTGILGALNFVTGAIAAAVGAILSRL